MKKIIAVLLSLLMIFSSLGVVASAADSEEDGESLIDKITGGLDYGSLGDSFDISLDIMSIINALAGAGGFDASELVSADGIDMEAVIANEALAQNLVLFPAKDSESGMGFTAYDLYYSKAPVFWGSLAGSTENGSIKTDLAILKANINTYLLSVLKKIIGGVGDIKLYTPENATRFINYIGHLINANFEDIKPLSGDKYFTEDGFYSAVVEMSGLATVIQYNWIDNPKVNYKSVLNALEYDYDDILLLGSYNKQKGDVVAKVLLKSIIKRVLEQGPLEYLLKVISRISASYTLTIYPVVEALAYSHVSCGTITSDELKTIKGLLNTFVNFNQKDNQHIQFIDAPVYRFGSATKADSDGKITTDTTDMFFYMLMYCNLVGQHKTNATDSDTGRIGGVDVAKAKVKSYLMSVKAAHEADDTIKFADKVNQSDIDVVDSVLGAFFKADLGSMFAALATIFTGNISNLKPNARRTLKDFFANIYRSIAKFFDRILYSLLHFGQF